MRKSLMIAILSVGSLAGCLTSAELGTEGDACDSEMLCIAALSCVDGVCMSLDGADAGNNTTDTSNNDSGTDMNVDPDMGNNTNPMACGGECSGETPVCDEDSDTCVECLGDGNCDGGVCLAGATTAENVCVECRADADCDAGVCHPTTNICVPCVDDADCTDVDAAKCEQGTTTAENACVACDASSQCAGITGTEVCADGSCVECTDESEDSRGACNGNSCDPSTNECTDTATESLDVCEACAADSECPEDYDCVPMEFKGTSHGNYCLRRFNQTACIEPFTNQLSRVSLSGDAAVTYCGIIEQNTTCEAVADRLAVGGTTCTMDEDCGDPNLDDDGLCRSVNATQKCTYFCTNSDQCSGTCNLTTNACAEDV